LDDIDEEQFNLIMRTITESMPEPDGKKKRARSSGKT